MHTATQTKSPTSRKATTKKKGLGQKTADAIKKDADTAPPISDTDMEKRFLKVLKAAQKLVDAGRPANAKNIAAMLTEMLGNTAKGPITSDAISNYLTLLVRSGRMLSQTVEGSGKCYVPQEAPAEKAAASKPAKPARAAKKAEKPAKPAKTAKAPKTNGERRYFLTPTYYAHLAAQEATKAAVTRNTKGILGGHALWLTPAEEALVIKQCKKDAGTTEPRIGLAKTAHAFGEKVSSKSTLAAK